jgi:hypothetical protein
VQKADKGRIPRRQIAKSDFERILENECEKLTGKKPTLCHTEEVIK